MPSNYQPAGRTSDHTADGEEKPRLYTDCEAGIVYCCSYAKLQGVANSKALF